MTEQMLYGALLTLLSGVLWYWVAWMSAARKTSAPSKTSRSATSGAMMPARITKASTT